MPITGEGMKGVGGTPPRTEPQAHSTEPAPLGAGRPSLNGYVEAAPIRSASSGPAARNRPTSGNRLTISFAPGSFRPKSPNVPIREMVRWGTPDPLGSIGISPQIELPLRNAAFNPIHPGEPSAPPERESCTLRDSRRITPRQRAEAGCRSVQRVRRTLSAQSPLPGASHVRRPPLTRPALMNAPSRLFFGLHQAESYSRFGASVMVTFPPSGK